MPAGEATRKKEIRGADVWRGTDWWSEIPRLSGEHACCLSSHPGLLNFGLKDNHDALFLVVSLFAFKLIIEVLGTF